MIHTLTPTRANLHGSFDRDRPPVLTVDSGSTIVLQTPDAGWGRIGEKLFGAEPLGMERDPETDKGHALLGPIAVRGAEPGQILEVKIEEIRPGPFGGTLAGQLISPMWEPLAQQSRPSTAEDIELAWRIEADEGVARADIGDKEMTVRLQPFMGVLGNAPAEPGIHETRPPRRVGGNIDCRELVAGSTLWLPIEVEGALFSIGDGHAAQGDGEISGTAIECAMDRVQISLFVRTNLHFDYPQATTPAGYITFGFGQSLEEASEIAIEGMLEHLQGEYRVSRAEAIALASIGANLRITQIVNAVVGVHMLLPRSAISTHL